MKIGFIISGLAHGALIGWLLFGNLFLPAPEAEFVEVAQVSILSEAEFAALSAPPPQPSVAPQVAPLPPPRPEARAPEAEPTPPLPPEAQAPEAQAEPAPPSPPVPESAPADIDRVAPEAAPEPSPSAEIAPEATPEVAPGEVGDVTLPESPETAPEAATTEIVTEATETAELAPARAPRPPVRPARPAPTPEPTPEPAPEPAADPVADAVAEAVAEASATPQPAAPTSPAPSGPPLSRGEKRAFRVAVGNCWNVGSLSSEALATTVVVAVSMTPAGKPEVGSIRMVSFSGGSERAARRAFDAARRAIIRCGANGYNLPSDKYAQWKEIEMTFNPENMRIK